MKIIIIGILNSLGFRIRGGFGEKWGWKIPLCKWFFATIWTACAVYLTKNYDYQYILSVFIGARLATAFCGWGEAVGCALGTRKPEPKEMNELDFDEFCDNFHIKNWKLIEHPQAYGVVWLTLRGVLLSYLIASPMNNLLLMLAGAPMGLIYWFAGWLYRKGVDDGKRGWRTAEWLYGFYLGVVLAIIYLLIKK